MKVRASVKKICKDCKIIKSMESFVLSVKSHVTSKDRADYIDRAEFTK